VTDRLRTPADLEDTFRKASDPNYAADLEDVDGGVGWDTVAADAQLLGKTSAAVRRNTQAYYLLPSSTQSDDPASGAVRASGTVQLTRTGSASLELRIATGKALAHSVLDSVGAPARLQDFALGEDAVFPVGELGPISVLARASRAGNQGNLPAGTWDRMADEGRASVTCTVAADGVTLTDTGSPDVFWEGLVGRYLRVATGVDTGEIRRVTAFSQAGAGTALLGSVTIDVALTPGTIVVDVLEWSDFGVTVVQPDAFTDGRHGTLDAIVRERLVGRAPGEPDLDYAYRINELPDVVTPNAIDRICARILTPYAIPYRILETRVDIPGVVLDLSPMDIGGFCDPLEPWYGNLLLTLNATKRFFVVLVGDDPGLGMYGLPFDAMNAGVNAYDSGGPGDGVPVTYNQVIAKLYASIEAARGFGVAWKLVQESCL
jgi:hypothetical protein